MMRSLILAFATSTAQDIFLARTSEALDSQREFMSWKNAPLPEGATDPNAGATYVYEGRNEAYDLELAVFDGEGRSMIKGSGSQKVKKFLRKVVRDIFAWNSTEWAASLDALGPHSVFDKEDVLSKKGDLYWEHMAQHVVERVFGPETWIYSPMMLFGPDCMTADGHMAGCHTGGLDRASAVEVRITIDGHRNSWELSTEKMQIVAQRDATNSSAFDVTVHTRIPVPNHNVASQYREQLDMRPWVGDGDSRISAELVTTSHGVGNYPSYQCVFIPLRHLLLQGDVEDPKLPQSRMRYPDVKTFQTAADAMIEDMRVPPATESVRSRTYPFITKYLEKYYYMWDSPPVEWWDFCIGDGWEASGYDDVALVVTSA